MVRAGKSISVAAARHGVTVRTAYLACKAEGLTFGRGGDSGARAGRDRLLGDLVRAGRRGLTAAQLAERFGVPRQVAANASRRAGVALPRSAHPDYARTLAARAALRPRAKELAARLGTARSRKAARLLLGTDSSFGDIAARCGITGQRVHQVWDGIRRAAGS